MFEKQTVHALLSRVQADGFTVTYWDGSTERYGQGAPRFGLRLCDPGVIGVLMADVENGFADAYIDGRIEVEGDLADVIAAAVRNASLEQGWVQRVAGRAGRAFKRRSLGRQKEDISRHYDLGNDFFRLWLDRTMTYSCAYFQTPEDSLEAAQRQKIEHSLRKLRLVPGERLLDIGSGWGSLILRAAEEYGVTALGITLSEEQFRATQQAICERGLQDRVEVRLENYAQLARRKEAPFDKVISIGMMEHVGKAHLAEFARDVAGLLKPGGLALLHHITSPYRAPSEVSTEPGFIERIFPGGYIPEITESLGHLAARSFHILDVENLREHYRMTLDHWSKRYEENVEAVRTMFGEAFVRTWRLYLRGCSAGFREGSIEIHQFLASKDIPTSYPLTRADLYSG